MERLKDNKKITKKGKKNRKLSLEDCKRISAESLVSYIEKKKTALRKLKRAFIRKKKVEEARCVNSQFKTDPGKVYASFNKVIESDTTDERPKFKNSVDNEENSRSLFENIGQACAFWKELWTKEGTGDEKAGWLNDIRSAINGRVSQYNEMEWVLETSQAVGELKKKKNWSAPGPDKIANFWWKHVNVVHDGVIKAFRSIGTRTDAYPLWFAEGKTTLIPKPGVFASENHRPITCLNTIYYWFTSCLLQPMDQHLRSYGLMEEQQRGAKSGCSGTVDNLLIDQMVT